MYRGWKTLALQGGILGVDMGAILVVGAYKRLVSPDITETLDHRGLESGFRS